MSDERNPYLDMDADADLLDDRPRARRRSGTSSGQRHTLSAPGAERTCWCGRPHVVEGIDDVPPEILEGLNDFIDGMPTENVIADHIVLSRSRPGTHGFVHQFLEFARGIATMNQNGPLLRAVAEVLNDITDGAVEGRWKVYSLERDLIVCHTILKAVNNVKNDIDQRLREDNPVDEDRVMGDIVDKISQITLDRLHQLQDLYEAAATDVGMRADDRMKNFGILDDNIDYGAFARFTMHEAFDREMGADHDFQHHSDEEAIAEYANGFFDSGGPTPEPEPAPQDVVEVVTIEPEPEPTDAEVIEAAEQDLADGEGEIEVVADDDVEIVEDTKDEPEDPA